MKLSAVTTVMVVIACSYPSLPTEGSGTLLCSRQEQCAASARCCPEFRLPGILAKQEEFVLKSPGKLNLRAIKFTLPQDTNPS